jgi:anti-anti-sigma factor
MPRGAGSAYRARIGRVAPRTEPVPDGFTIASGFTGATTQVVVVGGAVGLAQARQVEAVIVEGLCARRTAVVLDLTDVDAIGPGLLGVLLRVRRGVGAVGGHLVLVVAGPPVSELVATSLLGRLLDVAEDRAGAMELIATRESPAPAATSGRSGGRR